MNLKQKLMTLIVSGLMVFGLEGLEILPDAGAARMQNTRTVTATSTRTATVTPTRTVTPTPAYAEFTLTNINTIPASDVMGEMFVFAAGGGMGFCPIRTFCQPSPLKIVEIGELGQAVQIDLCWTDPNDLVTLVVVRPDGRTNRTALRPKEGKVAVRYQTRYNDPVGEYALFLSGAKSKMEIRVRFTEPVKPLLIDQPFWPFSPVQLFTHSTRRSLVLDHFIPGEKVRLFTYQYNQKLIGWQNLTVRGDGTLPVQVDLSMLGEKADPYFVAIGERSGEVKLSYPCSNLLFFTCPMAKLTCPGAKPTRLQRSSAARVAYTDGRRLRVHKSPGFGSPVIAMLPEGTQIFLIDQAPECSDRSWFWMLMLEKDKFGWVAEADQSVYLVEPVK